MCPGEIAEKKLTTINSLGHPVLNRCMKYLETVIKSISMGCTLVSSRLDGEKGRTLVKFLISL